MANYIRTSAKFSDLVNAEIKESNSLKFSEEFEVDVIEEALSQNASNGYVVSLTEQYFQNGYLTPKQIETLLNLETAPLSTYERNADSQHVCSIGETTVLTLCLKEHRQWKERNVTQRWDNGDRSKYLFQDKDGNEVVYFGTAKGVADAKVDKTYRIKCNIKQHSEWDGVKNTVISFPQILRPAEFTKVDLRKSTDVSVPTKRTGKKRIRTQLLSDMAS